MLQCITNFSGLNVLNVIYLTSTDLKGNKLTDLKSINWVTCVPSLFKNCSWTISDVVFPWKLSTVTSPPPSLTLTTSWLSQNRCQDTETRTTSLKTPHKKFGIFDFHIFLFCQGHLGASSKWRFKAISNVWMIETFRTLQNGNRKTGNPTRKLKVGQ